jgi:hypothetical protein
MKCPNKGHKWGCCCHCYSHKELYSHPWVDKKPMSNQLGYVCTVFWDMDRKCNKVILSGEHGLCEAFQERIK